MPGLVKSIIRTERDTGSKKKSKVENRSEASEYTKESRRKPEWIQLNIESQKKQLFRKRGLVQWTR